MIQAKGIEWLLGRAARWRRPILLVWALAVVAAGALYLARFEIDNSVGIWFLPDDPEREVLEVSNRIFGATEWTFALVETRDIFDAGFLAELGEAAERIEALGYVERVVSIANVRDSDLDAEETLRYRPILRPAGERATPGEIAAFADRLGDNPVFAGNLYQAGDRRHTALMIQNTNLLEESRPYRLALVDEIRAVLEDYPSIERVALAGTTVINAELNRAAARDMLRYYLLIGVFLLICALVALPHRRDLPVLLAVVLGSVVPTLGVAATLGLSFNMITIMLPTVLVAMGVSAVVHLITEFHQVRRRLDPGPALAETLAGLWTPALWTTLTTVAGFLSLALSEVIPVRQIGVLAALGILLAWVNTFVVAPLLLGWLWPLRALEDGGSRRRRRLLERLVGGLTRRVTRSAAFRGRVLIGTAVLAPVLLLGLLRLQADTDYVRFFRTDSVLASDYRQIDETAFAQYYLSLRIDYAPDLVFTDQPGFEGLQRLRDAIGGLVQVRKVLDAPALLREAERALSGARPGAGAFARSSAPERAQLLLLAEASGNADLTDLVSGERGHTQLLVLTDNLSTRSLGALRARIEALARLHLPAGMRWKVTGTSVLWANMDANVVATQIRSLALTLAVLALLLPLVLRSAWLGLLGLALSALPIALTLAVMGWLGVEINIATCLIGGIALGVAVDDSIYLLSRMQRESRRGIGRRTALRRALSVTGSAMVTTSAILVGGFATMIGSDFLPSAHFAALFSLAVVLALLADLVLVPAVILGFADLGAARRMTAARRLIRLLPWGERACRQR